jgi:hypothetical protein
MQLILTILLTAFSFQTDSLVYTVQDQERTVIMENEVLFDKGYDLAQILSDSTLKFKKMARFKADSIDKYWMRLQLYNPGAYSQGFYLWVYPSVKNVVHAYDANLQRWTSQQSGYFTPSGNSHTGYVLLNLPARETSTIYVEVDASYLHRYDHTEQSRITIWKKEVIDSRKNYVLTAWMITIGIVVVLFLYNGYVYFFFRDKTYLHYLILLVGGMMYVTGINSILNVLWPLPSLSVYYSPTGGVYFYDYNSLLTHLGTMLVMAGFVQMTRFYLNTKTIASFHDKLLKYSLLVFILYFSITVLFSATGWLFISHITSSHINIMVMVLVVLMIWAGISVNRKAFKPARYYLIAHSVPFIFIMGLAFYFYYFKTDANGVSVFSNIIITVQAMTFAVALVARMQLLKSQLEQRTLELGKEKIENEKLNYRLDYNYREMASSALYQSQRNELLIGLKTKMDGLTSILEGEAKAEARKIKSAINQSISLESDWEKFKLHFEQVHPNFFEELKANYPNLTQNETRLSAYFHINLSVKEIATLMNIAPESVRKAKTRLNKKVKSAESKSSGKETTMD